MFSLPYLSKEAPLVFWRNTVLIWLVYFAFFYLHYLWLVPQWLIKNRLFPYCLFTLGSSLLFMATMALIWGQYHWSALLPSSTMMANLVFCCCLNYFGATALRLLEYWLKSERTKVLLQKEVRETELLYLKSQMSPHFLFNTLNNIYGLAINQSQQTPLALRQLKDMMLYIQHFKDGARIHIDEEVNYLKSFIALNLLRYDCRVDFETDIRDQLAIEPMILLPFLENAFKHGDTRAHAAIQFQLAVKGKQLSLFLSNQIDAYKRKDDVVGIGIQNVKRRLDLLYHQQWQLTTSFEGEKYQVHLMIQQA